MTWKPAAATISASAACLTEFVADNINPSNFPGAHGRALF
jgi:hypothetical protein